MMRWLGVLVCAAALAGGGCATKPPRVVTLEGARNMRDLGGYAAAGGKQVRYGMVFRSDDLSALSVRDMKALRDLGIKTVVDFRSDEEAARAPDRVPEGVLAMHRLAITVGAAEGRRNGTLAREAQLQYTAFFDLLADDSAAPLLFHCAEGRDRTGFAAALFLAALGVERETIMREYLCPTDVAGGDARREYLEEGLRVVDREYGGVERYLQEFLGVDLGHLRGIYLR